MPVGPKKLKRLLPLVPLFFVLFVSHSSVTESAQNAIVPQPINVSMINLIADPEKFDGKVISVDGFLAIESEDARLYLSQEDYRHYIPENGIFIDVNKVVSKNMEKVDGHYAGLVGVFYQRGAPVSVGSHSRITDIRLCAPLLEFTEKRPRTLKDSQPHEHR
jgi:hypothetical protein